MLVLLVRTLVLDALRRSAIRKLAGRLETRHERRNKVT